MCVIDATVATIFMTAGTLLTCLINLTQQSFDFHIISQNGIPWCNYLISWVRPIGNGFKAHHHFSLVEPSKSKFDNIKEQNSDMKNFYKY